MVNLIPYLPSDSLMHNNVNEQFLLRVGGQPIDCVNSLQFTRTLAWIQQTLALETQLYNSKETVSEMLHAAVSAHKEDQKVRRTLINLKRALFNLRLTPSNSREAYMVAEVLAPEARTLLLEWLTLWERYQETFKQGAEIFSEEVHIKRTHFKTVVQTPDFRNGILLASPSLDQAIDTYLQSDNTKLSRTARTTERSLLEYLFRTACKTSPFSTLTSVSTGNIRYAAQASVSPIIARIDTLEKGSFTRLNLAVLSTLIQVMLGVPAIQDALSVRVTSGWRTQGKRIRYLRRRSNSGDYDPESPLALNVLHEDVLTLPIGPLLSALLAFMGDGRSVTVSELKAHLYTVSGLKEAKEEIDDYIQRLVRLHFLIVPVLQLDIHSHNPLLTFVQGLRSLDVPLVITIVQQLEQVNRYVQAYAVATQEQRRALLKDIGALLHTSYATLGKQDVVLPRTLLYEDTTVRSQELVLPQQHWQNIFAQLTELQTLLPIFDFNTSRKLITKGYFRARYGSGQRCNDVLAFADTFNLDFFEQHQKDAMGKETLDNDGKFTRRQNIFHLPEIERLDDARQAVADYISLRYEKMIPASSTLQLTQDFIDTIASFVPDHLKDLQSHAFFTQYFQEGTSPQLVVNRVYTGFTLMFSRFAHCFAEEEGYQVIPQLRARFAELQPEGAVFAELKGGYDATNLNLHPTVTSYELVCPGELSVRPLDEQISLDDLSIVDDLATDTLRLYSKRLGKEVIPVYLGFLVPMMLPEIQQILLNFSHMSMCPLDLWNGVTRPQDDPTQVIVNPRLQYKDLVLQRKQWLVPIEVLPQRAPEQADNEYFLTLNRWRLAHNVPARVFFKQVKKPRINDRNEIEDGYDGSSNTRKPLYVDFENYFSLQLLEAHTRKMKGCIQFTEMLPEQDQLWLNHQGHSYVSELVFEINSTVGGNHAEH